MRRFIFLIAVTVLVSCEQNDTKQKELELKQKELQLKEQELKFKEDSINKNTSLTNQSDIQGLEKSKEISEIVTELKFPIKVSKLNVLIGRYKKFTPFQEPNDEASYEWELEDGLVITGSAGYLKPSSSDIITDIIWFSCKQNNTPINCLLGLQMNKTSLDECKKKFAGKLKKVEYWERTYKFYQDKIYYYLGFDKEGILTSITKATFEYDMAG